ncbi:hypothetical protein P3342_012393 [Pyrenophora teres f. teres]|uniref:Uncharacterized protein n=1 Tax=Pyrenophora teres f. teres (strain 0-1) TaxID=861557 RepID=E3RDW9_PYRTT|nr:hypothetical protein PTT_03257 [Pyrenophora teres f. teres 0-1]KAK1916749.1 hypothetical protein P3342_012393 [Pyrenophora teres f. teres]
MAYEDKSMYTPIRRECIQSIQQRFKERPQLRMLLEKGIVPLFIQDGGVSTMQTRFWSWSTEFPFIKLAYFEQAKRRACFEFLLPHPKRKRAVRFHKLLGQNNWGYGIQLRACNQVLHKELIGRWSYPAAPYPDVPLSVGAESALEPMLPLLPDKPLDAGRLNTVDGLQWYLKNNESASIPLLHYTDVCIFRVEAGHWGPAELDSFVLACAEKAGMQYRFPVDLMRNQAIKTLERNGLATKVD